MSSSGSLAECPVIPEMEDLYEDMCDGACLCTVAAFYRPQLLRASGKNISYSRKNEPHENHQKKLHTSIRGENIIEKGTFFKGNC